MAIPQDVLQTYERLFDMMTTEGWKLLVEQQTTIRDANLTALRRESDLYRIGKHQQAADSADFIVNLRAILESELAELEEQDKMEAEDA